MAILQPLFKKSLILVSGLYKRGKLLVDADHLSVKGCFCYLLLR